MPNQYAGGCACGAIRYQCNSEPSAMYNCHCRICQLTGGGPFSSLLVMPLSSVSITGTPKYARVRAVHGNHTNHGFCGECGSSLFVSNPERDDLLLIKAATLDESDWFNPIADIWAISALPWTHMDHHIPKVLRSPPLLEKDAVVRF